MLNSLWPFKTRAPATKKIFVHAGTHKTGTSYFQHAAYSNTDQLRQTGILYPSTGLGIKTNHNRYAHRVLGIDIATGKQNRFPSIVEELNKDSSLDTALISYEGFCHPETIENIYKVRHDFSSVDLHVILVFRPHIDFAISLYRELCQQVSFRGSLYNLLHPESPRALYWGQCLEYRTILKSWRRIVGKNNIHTVAFGKIRHDISGSLMSIVGYNEPVELPDNLTRNHTLSAPFAALMRLVNRQELPSKARHKIASEVAAVDIKFPEFSRYCEISQSWAHELEHKFAKDRKALKTYGLEPNEDLMIGQNWRWGTDTNMTSAIVDARQAVSEHLKNIDEKALLKIIDAAPKDLDQPKFAEASVSV